MEFSSVIHALAAVLLISSIACQDPTNVPDAVTTVAAVDADKTTAGDASEVTTQAPAVPQANPCESVSANVNLCNEKLEEGDATCEKIEEHKTCVEKSVEGCSDEQTISDAKASAEDKRLTKSDGLDCAEAPAKEEVTTEEITTVPTTTEPPLPKCEDPIAKAAEVQKCNDKIQQDSLCIQIQKAVDCVEVKTDCSEANFDQEIDKYLASFENYAQDYNCIITYRGKRLEQRSKPGQAAQSQAQSGASLLSISLFSSFAVIFTGLALSH